MSRVLVVDDSETVVNFLRMVLESEQYEVDTASDGNEGLAKAHQSLPDLIITDSIMPGMDGFSLLHAPIRRPRRCRSSCSHPAIPTTPTTSCETRSPTRL
jgi:CheY-like chemotaxis protein